MVDGFRACVKSPSHPFELSNWPWWLKAEFECQKWSKYREQFDPKESLHCTLSRSRPEC